MSSRAFFAFLVLVLLSPTASAQGPSDVGLTVLLPNQRFGSVCTPFACQPTAATVGSGTSFHVTTWGALRSPYVVAAAATTGSCLSIPPFHNSLALGLPLFPLHFGVITQPVTRLCVGGFDGFTVNVPMGLSGATFALQAIATSPVGPSFTNALRVNVL